MGKHYPCATDMASVIKFCDTEEGWRATISSVGGRFCSFTARSDEARVEVDLIRPHPLFYDLYQGILLCPALAS
jgi:hypothetical protein